MGEKGRRRDERKERTRQRLLDAALALLSDDETFAGLSLRKVASGAHITPNAFYRHFDSLEELAAALLDGVGPTLRRMTREVKKRALDAGPQSAAAIVDAYMEFVRDNRSQFTLIVRARSGGSPAIRAAIRREMGYFASELANEINEQLRTQGRLSSAGVDDASQLIVELMLAVATEILDLGPESLEHELAERLTRQLSIIWAGALAIERTARTEAK